ncbi:urease accessory protein UreD [Actinomycetospora sp. CA-101289]|uniref:urease accessory protein UreD n=1 Tax=Actinomycetospora sp. CA-101289 TaxID=3239893 RepID=UPI003D97D612
MTPARLAVHAGRVTWTSRPPVVLRRTGATRVHLVQVGGGPLGGDALGLDVEVGPGQYLELCSAAATVVQPGRVPGSAATFAVTARVAPGGALWWRPEPTIVTDGAVWDVRLRLELAAGAAATVTEQLVLGRAGQRGGRVDSSLDVRVDQQPLLVTTTRLDGADPALAGPGGTAGASSVGTVLRAGEGAEEDGEDGGVDAGAAWARTPLAGPGSLLSAVGTPRAVADVLRSRCPIPARTCA